MPKSEVFVPIKEIAQQPTLTLTNVRWEIEKVTVPEGEDIEEVEEVPFFRIVGEKFRLEAVKSAANEIASDNKFLPPRFWLVYDSNNLHDPNAIAAYAILEDQAYHVGFLPRNQTDVYRTSMERLNRSEQTLEVLGCFTHGRSAGHPFARIYLPLHFADLVLSGYATNQKNTPAWLIDTTQVLPRPYQGHNARRFTDSELCRIYCWFARKQGHVCFPNDCESAAIGFRSSRGRIPEAMDEFVLDPDHSPDVIEKLERLHDTAPAREFVRRLMRVDAVKNFGEDEAERRMKQVKLSARLHGHEGEVYQVSVHNTEPKMRFAGEVQVRRTGPQESDFIVEKLIPPPKQEEALSCSDALENARDLEGYLADDLDKMRDIIDDFESRSKEPPEIIGLLEHHVDRILYLRDEFVEKRSGYSDFHRAVLEELIAIKESIEEVESTAQIGLGKRLLKKAEEWFSAFDMP